MSEYTFIASDHKLPLIDFSGLRYYKFKEGVVFDIDSEGKLYHYTNENDKNSPELLIPCCPEEADNIICEAEEDFKELKILNAYRGLNLEFYTIKAFIYTLEWRYSYKRGLKLIDYLKDNLKEGYEIEICSIWLDSYDELVKYYIDIEDLSVEDFKKVFEGLVFEKPQCIVISNKKK